MRQMIGVCMALIMASALCRAEVTKTREQYLILPPPRPVKIDGKLDEWDLGGSATSRPTR